jgi:hypothetical protein
LALFFKAKKKKKMRLNFFKDLTAAANLYWLFKSDSFFFLFFANGI